MALMREVRESVLGMVAGMRRFSFMGDAGLDASAATLRDIDELKPGILYGV